MSDEIGLGVRLGLQAIIVLSAVAVVVFAWRAWVAWQRLRRVLTRGDAPGPMGSAEALAATVAMVREARGAAPVGAAPPAHQHLAGLDRSALAITTGRIFSDLHGALASGDVAPMGDRLTPELYAQLRARCAAGGRATALAFRSAEVTAAWREDGREHAIVRLTGAITDGVGSRVEEWRLVRPVGERGWKVAGIAPAPTR
jgi:predicted lipid-binding transport protein (Tim44 family)